MLPILPRQHASAATRAESFSRIRDFSATRSCQSSSVSAKKSAGSVAPALLTSTPSRLKCPTASATAYAGTAGSRGSAATVHTAIFAIFKGPCATRCSFSESRANRQRCIPPCASSRAAVAPVARPAPVTSATFSLSSNSVIPPRCLLRVIMRCDQPIADLISCPGYRSTAKFIKWTMALLAKLSYIALAGFQERNIWQKMCWA